MDNSNDRAKLKRAWSGQGVYSVQYAERWGEGLEPVDGPRKFHACAFGELWDQHECWVNNDALDLVVLSVEKLPPDGMTTADLLRAFEEYKGRTGWRGLDAESAIESFIRFTEAGA